MNSNLANNKDTTNRLKVKLDEALKENQYKTEELGKLKSKNQNLK
jgi:hypothetical protein